MLCAVALAGALALPSLVATFDGQPRAAFRTLPSHALAAGLPRAVKPRTLYLLTRGVTLKVSAQSDAGCVPTKSNECSISDARRDTSWLPNLAVSTIEIPPFATERFGEDGDLVRQVLAAQVQAMFAGLAIDVTLKRPSDDRDYSMVIIGGGPEVIGMGPGIAGLAPLDCGDPNPWDISFVFPDVLGELEGVARVAVQEAAHSFGLEHVTESAYVMYPQPAQSPRGLGYACMRIEPSPDVSNPDGIKCLHTCISPAHQNGFEELRLLFGDSDEVPLPPDEAPPTASFARPAAGTHLPTAPASLRVDLRADDDVGVYRAFLRINEGPWVLDPTLPFGFNVLDLAEGVYVLEALVEDFDGKSTHIRQRLDVGPPNATPPRPQVDALQIEAFLEEQSGQPIACAGDASCYAGTRCIAGRCLRTLPASCALARGDRWHVWGFAVLWLICSARRHRRTGVVRCRAIGEKQA